MVDGKPGRAPRDPGARQAFRERMAYIRHALGSPSQNKFSKDLELGNPESYRAWERKGADPGQGKLAFHLSKSPEVQRRGLDPGRLAEWVRLGQGEPPIKAQLPLDAAAAAVWDPDESHLEGVLSLSDTDKLALSKQHHGMLWRSVINLAQMGERFAGEERVLDELQTALTILPIIEQGLQKLERRAAKAGIKNDPLA